MEVSKRYYEWTDALTPDVPYDGRAFYGRDSMANYFIIGMKQMGEEIFEVKDGKVTFHTDRDLIRRLWDNYYIPYINGYFASYGKFRSDDVKTGTILAYTGSVASSFYFPDRIETDDENYDIDCVVQQAPGFSGGENYNVQQGAGMAVTKSDAQHEYAACEFLKWFTRKGNNLRFVCESAYLPVQKNANTITSLDGTIKTNQIDMNQKAYQCLKEVLTNFDQTKFYTTKSFQNGYSARNVLEHAMSDQAAADREAIVEAAAKGEDMQALISQYSSWFRGWLYL